MSDNIRVLIVDDHDIVREGQRALINTETGMEVIGEAKNGLEALDLVVDDTRTAGIQVQNIVRPAKAEHAEDHPGFQIVGGVGEVDAPPVAGNRRTR